MKLIIDIPEMAYEAFKEWHKNKVATVEQSIIANGKPYNPTGDLISREALKEVFTKASKDYNHEAVITLDCALATIDNAPTIDAIVNTIEVRPQGKWIDERNEGGCCTAICSNCKTLEVTGRFCRTCGSDNTQSFLKSFNCGADMRGNKKETTFDDYLKEQLKDSEFRKEWEKLCEESDNEADN